MNTHELARRESYLKGLAADLEKKVKAVKTNAQLKVLEPDLDRLQQAFESLDFEKRRIESTKAFNEKNGHGFGNAKGHDINSVEKKAVVPELSSIPEVEWRGLYEAAVRKNQTYRIDTRHIADVTTKAPFAESGFTSGSLPPTLLPSLTLDLPYEQNDAFASFKQMPAPDSRAVEYIQHTGNAAAASAVSELGVKPDLGLQLTTVTTPYVKIGATASASMEALNDFGTFMTWIPGELQRAIIDARTNEVLNGSGSSPHMLGILNTSGTLTRSVGSDTPLDAIRKAANDIRVGSSFAEASLVLTHPTTWQDLTLVKSTTGNYVLDPDNPNRLGDLHSIFGMRVVTNTYCPAGTAIVCDPNWIYAWTRMGLTIDMNSLGSDASTNYWTQNATSFRAEGRWAIGVARPTAVNIVTGLSSS